eukprot:SAG31_NODE_44590_length_262_cov_0.638037_2_plen_40_part_01
MTENFRPFTALVPSIPPSTAIHAARVDRRSVLSEIVNVDK